MPFYVANISMTNLTPDDQNFIVNSRSSKPQIPWVEILQLLQTTSRFTLTLSCIKVFYSRYLSHSRAQNIPIPPPLPPILEYFVTGIVGHHICRLVNKAVSVDYLFLWDNNDVSWEPESNINHCIDLIRNYLLKMIIALESHIMSFQNIRRTSLRCQYFYN